MSSTPDLPSAASAGPAPRARPPPPLPLPERLSAGVKLRRAAIIGVAYGLLGAWFLSGIGSCPTAATLGIPCPGCGLTRATLAAAQGNIAKAFALHPLFWLISPLMIGLLLAAALGYIRGRSALPFLARVSPKTITIAGVAFSALAFGVWIARFYGAFGGPVPVG